MIKQEQLEKAYKEFLDYWDGIGFPEASDRYVKLAFYEGYKAAKKKESVVPSVEFHSGKGERLLPPNPLTFTPKVITSKRADEITKEINNELKKATEKTDERNKEQEQLYLNFKPKKNYPSGREKRSSKVISEDAYIVSDYLKNMRGEVPLSVIIRYMNKAGKKHWNTNNASSFMRLMIKDKYPVVKVAHGMYKYQKGE